MSHVTAYIEAVDETDSEEESRDSILLNQIITFVSRNVKRCTKKTVLQVLRNQLANAQKEKTTFFHYGNETTGFANASEVSEIRFFEILFVDFNIFLDIKGKLKVRR